MNQEKSFRLYQTEESLYSSSIFDLIDGDNETKQTKGLAYLFYSSDVLLSRFLKLEKVKKCVSATLKNSNYKFSDIVTSDFYRVDAEMLSLNKINPIRRDITISFYKDMKKIFVIVIEAKSVKLSKFDHIEDQLEQYFDEIAFPHEVDLPRCGFTLTKYEEFLESDEFSSLTWNEIIILLKDLSDNLKDSLITDYYNFITGVDKNMHYYEKEILSLPAGKTSNIVEKYGIHACPDTKNYNYKKPIYITFRKSNGGEMEKLYKVESVISLNPHNDSEIVSFGESELDEHKRVTQYINERKSENGMGFNDNNKYRFYILDTEENIELEHRPRPIKNNPSHSYYKLSELLSGKENVKVAK